MDGMIETCRVVDVSMCERMAQHQQLTRTRGGIAPGMDQLTNGQN